MATAGRAVVVFVKEFQQDQRPRPLPKRFNSPFPQNLFCIKKNIPVITEVKTQLFPIAHKISKIKLRGKPKTQIFSGGPPPPPTPRLYTWGARLKKKSLIEPCAKVCQSVPKLSNEALLKSFLSKFLVLSTCVPRRRSAAKITARWRCRLPIKNLTPHYRNQFCVSIHLF